MKHCSANGKFQSLAGEAVLSSSIPSNAAAQHAREPRIWAAILNLPAGLVLLSATQNNKNISLRRARNNSVEALLRAKKKTCVQSNVISCMPHQTPQQNRQNRCSTYACAKNLAGNAKLAVGLVVLAATEHRG